MLLDGTLGKNVQDFRTYLAPWSGQPTTTPLAGGPVRRAAQLTVAASWNGATEVASWQVLGGTSATSLTPVATAPQARVSDEHPACLHVPRISPCRRSTAAGAVIGRSPTIKA